MFVIIFRILDFKKLYHCLLWVFLITCVLIFFFKTQNFCLDFVSSGYFNGNLISYITFNTIITVFNFFVLFIFYTNLNTNTVVVTY